MKIIKLILLFVFIRTSASAQPLTIGTGYQFQTIEYFNTFKANGRWLGGDGASSIELGNNRILWLFGDSFIGNDTSLDRKKAHLINNCISIQQGKVFIPDKLKFYWNTKSNNPTAFFKASFSGWYWPGHGTMIKDRLLVFLMRISRQTGGLGFSVDGWDAALIMNPEMDPQKWMIKIIEGEKIKGRLIGSSAVLVEGKFVYAYTTIESPNQEVKLVRWKTEDAYQGLLDKKEWWIGTGWQALAQNISSAKTLFNGQTEFSVHFDSSIKKYIQVQTFGFGDASIGMRLSDNIQGEWSEPMMLFKPDTSMIIKPMIYSAKAHPEQNSKGLMITYNINSFDFSHLLANMNIYFPRMLEINIKRRE